MSGSATDITIAAFLLLLPYLFVMLRLYRGLTMVVPFSARTGSSPTISVIIATNRSPGVMENLIDDLRNQSYQSDLYEIIIADDSKGLWNSETLPDKGQKPFIKIISNPGSGKKSAMKSAVEMAHGEVVVTTDDDCRVGPRWLHTIAAFLTESNADMILCPVSLEGSNSLFSRLQQLEFAALQGATAGSSMVGDPIMCNGAGMAFRRRLYPGNYTAINPEILSGDDTFLMHHMKRNGDKIAWLESEDAVVKTPVKEKIGEFFRQRSRWASKATHYTDGSTILTGAAVLTASVVTGGIMIMAIFDTIFLLPAFATLLFKSVPDILIIANRLRFYKMERTLRLFPAAQIIYPFYVIISITTGVFRKSRW